MHKTGLKRCPTGAEPRAWFDNRPLSHKSGRPWGPSQRPKNATTELLCVRAYAFFSHLSVLKMRTHVRIKLTRSKIRPLGPLLKTSESAAQPSGPDPQAQTYHFREVCVHHERIPPQSPAYALGNQSTQLWNAFMKKVMRSFCTTEPP